LSNSAPAADSARDARNARREEDDSEVGAEEALDDRAPIVQTGRLDGSRTGRGAAGGDANASICATMTRDRS
jgi:hypothetical protein